MKQSGTQTSNKENTDKHSRLITRWPKGSTYSDTTNVMTRLAAMISLTLKCNISILSESSINLIMKIVVNFCDIHLPNNTQICE